MNSDQSTPELLLGVPAYNESDVIAASVGNLIATLESAPFAWNIVVIDNASTDTTASIVMSLEDERVSLLSVPQKGKGHAVRAGARKASESGYRSFAFIDADLSADPQHLKDFVAANLAGEADVVVGSRLIDKSTVERGLLRTLTSEILCLIRNAILRVPVADSQCGLKVMNRKGMDVLLRGEEGGWFWDVEFLAHAARDGLVIRELPVRWDEFRFPGRKSKLNVIRDGVHAVITLVRIRIRMLRFR